MPIEVAIDSLQVTDPAAFRSSAPEMWVIGAQERSLDRISEWIRAVDAKGAPIIAIDTALTATLVALSARPGAWTQWTAFWLGLGIVLPLLSMLMVSFASAPQLKGQVPSLMFFGDIAATSLAEFEAKIANRTRLEYLKDLDAQCHRNSEIASRKFRWIRLATLILFIATVPWLVSLFFVVLG